MSLPKVSIVVPSYNHSLYIEDTIKSIVNQSYTNIELIVIDDGSRDDSIDLLKKLQAQYSFVLVSQDNIGLSATLNRGLKEFCDGKYVAFCASDDIWLPSKIELQVAFMEANKEIPMCYGKVHYIDESSTIIEKYDSQNDILKGGDLFEDILLFKLHPPVTYLYKRELFDEIGYFNKDIFAEDYYMNLNVASRYDIGFINEYLGLYRVDSSAQKVGRFKIVSESHLQTIDGYKDHPMYSKAIGMVYLRMFLHFAPHREFKLFAVKNAIKSRRYCFDIRYIKASIKLFIFYK